jgi:hypothetical protein
MKISKNKELRINAYSYISPLKFIVVIDFVNMLLIDLILNRFPLVDPNLLSYYTRLIKLVIFYNTVN